MLQDPDHLYFAGNIDDLSERLFVEPVRATFWATLFFHSRLDLFRNLNSNENARRCELPHSGLSIPHHLAIMTSGEIHLFYSGFAVKSFYVSSIPFSRLDLSIYRKET